MIVLRENAVCEGVERDERDKLQNIQFILVQSYAIFVNVIQKLGDGE